MGVEPPMSSAIGVGFAAIVVGPAAVAGGLAEIGGRPAAVEPAEVGGGAAAVTERTSAVPRRTEVACPSTNAVVYVHDEEGEIIQDMKTVTAGKRRSSSRVNTRSQKRKID